MDERIVRATQRILRATQRVAQATGVAVKLGLRVTLASGGVLLMLGGLLLIHPLGQGPIGLPLFGLGFVLAFKAVFW
jgi:hypothetical protein